MHAALLHLDDALERQPDLQAQVLAAGGRVLAARDLGPALRLWTRDATLAELRRRLANCLPLRGEGELVFAGSGDFHHVTPLLLERAIARSDEPVTLLHFDNHPDWARLAPGRHCGSWVSRAARLPGVARVITVGVTSPDIGRGRAREGDLALIAEDRLDLFAWAAPDGAPEVTLEGRAWPTIAALGEPAFVARLDAAIPTRSVYVTIDKDVLRPADAVTNWDQGQASLDFVTSAIACAAAGRKLAGADVVGDWSRAVYGGGPAAWVLKQGEALLDQPWSRPEPAGARTVNQAVNLKLLEFFGSLAS